MLNILYEQFPDHVTISGKSYLIETDFREWIRFMSLIDDDDVPWQMRVQLMMQWYTREMPEDIEASIYALGDFLAAKELYPDRGGGDDHQDREQKPAFSFEQDAGCIYSAFVDCYGIDLQTVRYMHWWKFKTLFDWLPETTEIKQRIYYRMIDINSIADKDERKRIRKIQKQIELKRKKTCLDDYEIGSVFA